MKKILLIEDDESLNRGISFKLTREGYEVLSAFSIEEARKNFREENVDLIILDVTYYKAKSVFPSDQFLEKMLYLSSENVKKKWSLRYKNWDLVFNQLMIFFKDRIKDYIL